MDRASHVFVVGTGRSGTTIMGQSLGRHSALSSISFEPQLIAQSETKTGLYILLGNEPVSEIARLDTLREYLVNRLTKPDRRGIRLFDWIPDYYGHELIDDLFATVSGDRQKNESAVRAFLDKVYTEPPIGKTAIVDDAPVNGRFIPELRSLFPNAKFVHMIREGSEVAKSYLSWGWNANFEQAAQRWLSQLTVTRQLGQTYGGPTGYMEVELNSLVQDRHLVMNSVLDFLGYSFEESVCDLLSRERMRQKDYNVTTEQFAYVRALAPQYYEEFDWCLRETERLTG